ncbi:MAG: ABC transporter ATP-binding protein [Bacilli bacterium]
MNIKLKNITHVYDGKKLKLDNFSIQISQGESICIIGKSGSGKTTLLNIIGLITRPSIGKVYYDDKCVLPNSKSAMYVRRSGIGYLFQNFALNDSQSVLDNLLIALEYNKLSKKEKHKKIYEVLKEFDLESKINKKIYTLSGGEQQRIALARIMLKECSVILADEPTANLDSENEQLILNKLLRLNELGKTLIVVTHSKKIAGLFDKIIEL